MDNSLSTPVTIQRADYRPVPWRIDSVELLFTLDTDNTLVKSRLACVKKRGEEGPLVLFGDDLELLSLRIDGHDAGDLLQRTDAGIELDIPGRVAMVEVVTRVNPAANTTLSGLYASKNGLFTQCEAEGFRRITYFPDRPDVMSRFSVRMEADRARFPVLLSNGNLVASGELPGGRHYAVSSPRICSRWSLPTSKCWSGARRPPAVVTCCCRCGSSTATSIAPATPWIRWCTPCAGTRRPSGWNSIWTAS
jgi:aminopeptidase N